jgi:hypothetical protein
MTGPEDIAVAIMGAFRRGKASRVCVGGLWYGRVEETSQAPYARFGVSMQTSSRLSNRHYLRSFGVMLEIWGDNGPVDGKRVREAIDSTMTSEITTVPGALKVVDVRPASVDLTLDDATRQASDVCLYSSGWTILVEGMSNG